MSEKKKMIKPNTTQVPNVFFDHVMADLEKSELKCVLYIIRRTFGFHKDGDFIPLSQFETGIVKSNGERLDMGTGLDKKTIRAALKLLIAKGIVMRKSYCFKCKKEFNGNRCGCLADKMMGHFFSLLFDDYTPVLRVHDSPLTEISGGMISGLRGYDSPFTEASDPPQKKDKRKTKESEPPESDSQKSSPAHKEIYGHIYEGESQEPGAEPSKLKDKYSFQKKPNLEAAAIFKNLAKGGPLTEGESTDENPVVKFTCMPCGVQTEFPDKDTALDGNCKKCNEPIFSEEEKVK